MVWAIVLILVLLIPLVAIVIDSQVGQALAERISSGRAEDEELSARLETMEAELRYLSEEVESLREESRFLRSLVEGPEGPPELGGDEDPPRLGAGR